MSKTFLDVHGNSYRLCRDADEADLAHYEGPNILPGVDIQGVDLSGARITGIDLERASVAHSNFSGAVLDGASFYMANARSVVFDDARMSNVKAIRGDFRASSFHRVAMTGGNFVQCDLCRCHFTHADLTDCYFHGADLSGSRIHRVNFTNCFCFQADFSRVYFNRVNFSNARLSSASFVRSRFYESYYYKGFTPDVAPEILDLLIEVPIGFEWPSTDVHEESPAASELLDVQEWPQVGMLKHFGYTVGANGLPQKERWALLDQVFCTNPLPPLNHEGYTEGWGDARTALRLQKMADSIAAFVRQQKRKSSPAWQAIEDWESDLGYLCAVYYTGNFNFFWPTTDE